jgi:hypothetical protein
MGVLVVLLSGCWAPAGTLDDAMEATAFSGMIEVRGWAFDRDSADPIQVHVYIDGSPVRAAMADQPRPDVAAAVADAHGRTGFDITVPASPGAHEVCVYGIDQVGGDNNSLVGCSSVFVSPTIEQCGQRPSDAGFYQAMVNRRPDGWLGSDLVNAVDLPDGSTLWLFGDTDWGTRTATGAYAPGWHGTTNSAIVQHGACTRALGSSAGFVPPGLYGDPNMLYWPCNAFVADGHLFVGFNRIRQNDLVRERSELVELSLPDLHPIGMQLMPDNGRQWTEAANVEDGWVYYHGLVGSDLYAARAPVNSPTALTYWDGTGWRADPASAVIVVAGAENGVIEQIAPGRWRALSKRFFENRVVSWTAPSPVGPFVPDAVDFADARPPTPEVWIYMPSLHRVPNGWVFALNRNNWEVERIRAGTAYYGPVFSSAPIA